MEKQTNELSKNSSVGTSFVKKTVGNFIRAARFHDYVEEEWAVFVRRTFFMFLMTIPLVFAYGAIFTSPMGWGWGSTI